jgi:hypothetical protein
MTPDADHGRLAIAAHGEVIAEDIEVVDHRRESAPDASALSARDFSGVLTQFVVGYLLEQMPLGTLDAVLRPAGETRDGAELSDLNTWSSYAQYRRLLEATGAVLGGPDTLATVGRHTFDSLRVPEWTETLRALGSPAAVYEVMPGLSDSAAPGCVMAIEMLGPNECRVQLGMRGLNETFPEFCAFELGLLSTLPQIFGFPAAEIVDQNCQSDGARNCQATLRWVSDDDEIRVRGAEMRAQLADARLDELQRTVAELVSGDGLEPVLTRVTAAARRAVYAPTFILDICANPAAERSYTPTESPRPTLSG